MSDPGPLVRRDAMGIKRNPMGSYVRQYSAWWWKIAAMIIGPVLTLAYFLGNWMPGPVYVAVGLGVFVLYWSHEIRRFIQALAMLVGYPESERATQAILRASLVGQRGDIAEAMTVLESVERTPRLSPYVRMSALLARHEMAKAQGDFDTAEALLTRVITFYVDRGDKSAISECLEKLAALYLLRGRLDDARTALHKAVQVGGGRMYRLSRVRVECALLAIALEAEDYDLVRQHAMKMLELARRWFCHTEESYASTVLAALAQADDDLPAARSWLDTAARSAGAGEEPEPDPYRVQRLTATAQVLKASGDPRGALDVYVQLMRLAAELRATWGERDAQAYFASRRMAEEGPAFTTAYELYLRAESEDRGLVGFADLLDLVSQTELRNALRSDVSAIQPTGAADDLASDIARTLGEIRAAEEDLDGPAHAASEEVLRVNYQRLERQVSQRFRRALEGNDRGETIDPRQHATAWRTHILQTRLVLHDERLHIAGMWTATDGVRSPFLRALDAADVRVLQEITGVADLVPGLEMTGTGDERTALGAAERADDGPAGVRGDAPNWKTTPRFAHLANPHSPAWAALGRFLLPPGLTELLECTEPEEDVPRLLLIPDQVLWRVPWAAIRLADGAENHLADHAILATLPSTSLLANPSAPVEVSAVDGAVAYMLGVNPEGLDIERDSLTTAFGDHVDFVASPAALMSTLDPSRRPPSFVMTSVHGNNGPGLAHALSLAPTVELSAARMLTLRFPPTMLVNACLSADLDERRGTDPIGIPTVALCRGAETVIGGLFPLPDGEARNPSYSHSTAHILAHLYPLLAKGATAPRALREAQRQWRKDRPPIPPWLWAGLVSITTRHDEPSSSAGEK